MKDGFEVSKSGRHRLRKNAYGCYILEKKYEAGWTGVPRGHSYILKTARKLMKDAESALCP